ncbi:MAG: lytic transglycosylase domain-containing protein, partial [Verrucomicrobia bacterium]|nr:lytic transglycosylase domain-containing protein [Cytophagales bacterium]
MEFAGLKLVIDDYARAKIQADVQRLVKSEQHYNILRERVYRFFPLMEKILVEENIPDDFKFLAVQESALLADAVSTSNAVGYWQFKKATALEMGLLINDAVDERKNIVSATRAASKYLKRNNYFAKNWIHTLLSYNLGLTGVRERIKDKEIGAAEMEIDGNTHWYVLRCLAHKLVFLEAMKFRPGSTLALLVHQQANGRTLTEVAQEMNVPLETMKLYNKWLIVNRVPDDKTYSVIIPVDYAEAPVIASKIKTEEPLKPEPIAKVEEEPT